MCTRRCVSFSMIVVVLFTPRFPPPTRYFGHQISSMNFDKVSASFPAADPGFDGARFPFSPRRTRSMCRRSSCSASTFVLSEGDPLMRVFVPSAAVIHFR